MHLMAGRVRRACVDKNGKNAFYPGTGGEATKTGGESAPNTNYNVSMAGGGARNSDYQVGAQPIHQVRCSQLCI